jgi:hypothetical protein
LQPLVLGYHTVQLPQARTQLGVDLGEEIFGHGLSSLNVTVNERR